ncbi:MAG: response regulator [Xanthobacteraceae bacterium]|jgi:CheY-like chemotaxis protein
MTALRILHVDDEPDIREVVDLSLALDPAFAVRSCDGGRDAVAAAIDWPPDLMLIDVMMPGMDGPATLAALRRTPQTAGIPVVFMTARAESQEIQRLKALGAVGVIAKPFDPMTLAATVRSQLHAIGTAALCTRFMARLRDDVNGLLARRCDMRRDATSSAAVRVELEAFARALRDAADVLRFDELGALADRLARAVTATMNGAGSLDDVDRVLDALLVASEPAAAAGHEDRYSLSAASRR